MVVVEQILFGFPLLPVAASIFLFGILAVIVYRISFHPLSQYPGPKLAAATGGYRIYYEIWKGGRMIQQLEALHKQYG